MKKKWQDKLITYALLYFAVCGGREQTCAGVTLCLLATFVITGCESFVALQSGE